MMVTPACPKCRHPIPPDDVNVGANLAFCRACNLAHELSVIARGTGIPPDVDLYRPPPGAWQRASGLGTFIGATQRSLSGAFFTFLFGGFWNGIVGVFVALALAATLGHLGISRPDWFPTPKMNGGPIGIGMTLFLWVFLTPFIAIGLAMIAAFLSCLGGRTELRIRDYQGELFSGIGPLGFRKRFKIPDIKDVRIETRKWRSRDGERDRTPTILIELAEGKPIKFGSSLREDRRQFIAAALRKAIGL